MTFSASTIALVRRLRHNNTLPHDSHPGWARFEAALSDEPVTIIPAVPEHPKYGAADERIASGLTFDEYRKVQASTEDPERWDGLS